MKNTEKYVPFQHLQRINDIFQRLFRCMLFNQSFFGIGSKVERLILHHCHNKGRIHISKSRTDNSSTYLIFLIKLQYISDGIQKLADQQKISIFNIHMNCFGRQFSMDFSKQKTVSANKICTVR